jgi:hypothetical protein
MGAIDFSSRYDDWTEGENLSFTSPPWREDQHEQILVFASQTKDGWIEATITPVKGDDKDQSGNEQKEACLLIRYMPPERDIASALVASVRSGSSLG